MSCWSRHVRLALLVLIVPALSTCDREELPSAPDVAAQSEVDLFENGPFYYYRPAPGEPNIRIPLQLDPTKLMVSAPTREDAAAALQDRGLPSVSIRKVPHVALDHFRVKLSGAAPEAVADVGPALRSDPRIDFVGHAYTTSSGGRMALVDRLVVKFRSEVTYPEVHSFVDSVGARVLREPLATSGRPIYWLSYPEDRDPLRVAAEIHMHPLVDWANADKIMDLRPAGHGPSDGHYDEQYYLNNSILDGGVPVDINVEGAWTVTKGSGVTVAVIGTGIDGTHPEISGQRADGPCWAGWDESFSDTLGNAWEPWGQTCEGSLCTEFWDVHETEVAGIIAAQHDGVGTVGMAPDAELFSARIQITDLGAFSTGAEIADAIVWAWQDCEADIVNGSFAGTTEDTDIADAISAGLSSGRQGEGTIFVFSAGNESDRANDSIAKIGFPASVSGALAVGAIDRYGEVANYSPRGAGPTHYTDYSPTLVFLDLVAPSGHTEGVRCEGNPADSTAPDVYTLDLYGARGCDDVGQHYVNSFSGTSATAPQVAGAAALLLSVEPGLHWTDVGARLRDSADVWGPLDDYGSGKLNISASLGLSIQSVTITGNSEVPPDDYCTWWADVTGGVSPYSYTWYKDGVYAGSGDEVSLNTGSTDFTLKVDVTDHAGDTGSKTRSVTVSSSAFGCFG